MEQEERRWMAGVARGMGVLLLLWGESPSSAEGPATTAASAPSDVIETVRGKDGWLYFANRFPRYTSENPNVMKNAEVMLDFYDQLKSAGIMLVLVPVPDQVWMGRDHWPDAKVNWVRSHFDKAFDFLRDKGVTVLDVTPKLEKMRAKGEKTALTQDSHLMPAAYEMMAADAAEAIKKNIKVTGRPGDFTTAISEGTEPAGTAEVTGVTTLKIPVSMNRVRHKRVQIIQPRQGSDVMILGDSHVTEYGQQGASFADHLAFDLGILPDCRVRIGDGGANTLRTDMARQKDNLEGTRVVVWIFWEAGMTDEGWKKVQVISK